MSMRDCMSAQMYASPSAMYVFHYFFLFAKVYMCYVSVCVCMLLCSNKSIHLRICVCPYMHTCKLGSLLVCVCTCTCVVSIHHCTVCPTAGTYVCSKRVFYLSS